MDDSPYQEKNAFENAWRVDLLEKVPAARLLVLLAGASAVVLGLITFLLQLNIGPREGPLGLYGTGPLVMMLIVNLVFGAFLLYGYVTQTTRETDWATVMFAFALVLVVLGGIAGAIAGILAGVGAISVIARNWRKPSA